MPHKLEEHTVWTLSESDIFWSILYVIFRMYNVHSVNLCVCVYVDTEREQLHEFYIIKYEAQAVVQTFFRYQQVSSVINGP